MDLNFHKIRAADLHSQSRLLLPLQKYRVLENNTSYIIIFAFAGLILFSLYLIKQHKKRKVNKLIKKFRESWSKPVQAHRDFFYIRRYFDRVENTGDTLQKISDKTCNDLDFNELFSFLDRTLSKIGQQYFYNSLRSIRQNTDYLLSFDRLCTLFKNDTGLRLKCQLLLYKLNSSNGYFVEELFHGRHLTRPQWLKWVYLSSLLIFVSIILMIYVPIFLIPLVFLFTINLFIHYRNKNKLYGYFQAIPELVKTIEAGRELVIIKSLLPFLNSPLIEPVFELHQKLLFLSIEKKIESEVAGFGWVIMEFFKITFCLEVIVFYNVIESIKKMQQNIHELYRCIGLVDSCISVASVQSGASFYCKPDFVSRQKMMKGQSLIHPLIENCVPNDLDIKSKSLLITGSNMAGKTSFIRAVTINCMLAQTIYTCFAKSFQLPNVKIYTSIRIFDDLGQHKSYYLEEVNTIKNFLLHTDDKTQSLFILDEIFKGTNTLERIAAGKAVLSYLNKNENFVIVSTHDIELAKLLKSEFSLFHFTETVTDEQLSFDYMLQPGKLKNRNAIKILKLNDFPEQIIYEALELVEKQHLNKHSKQKT